MEINDETRRYRIDRLLGKGGYGRVYRAELIGNVGFRKAVAVKLLHEDGVDEKTLQRFRDEARILGLLNDPAIIKVDPPIRLGGRWAVVMELADGAPSNVFLRSGPVPPGVAAEIIGECARALDAAYKQQVDGSPLQLLHRDLKPANVMITRAGRVKLLDFGIAKASFDTREAHTTQDLAGTVPYMAPERLEGQELPAGDVFSLGIMLRRYVRRDKSLGFGRWKDHPSPPPLTEARAEALQMASLMYQMEPEKRPSMREVEDACERIRRLDQDSPSLRRWAENLFPEEADPDSVHDPLLGAVLTEGTKGSEHLRRTNNPADTQRVMQLLTDGLDETDGRSTTTPVPAELTREFTSPVRTTQTRRNVAIIGAAAFLLGVGFVALGVLFGAMQAGTVRTDPMVAAPTGARSMPEEALRPPEPEEPQTPEPEEPTTAATGSADGDVASAAPTASAPVPATVEVAAPRPSPTAPSPTATPPAPVVKVASPAPVPAPAEPPPSRMLTLGSVPTGAEVLLDGRLIGQTPLMGVAIPHGSHQLAMRQQGTVLFEKTITVGSRTPARYIYRDGELEAHQ